MTRKRCLSVAAGSGRRSVEGRRRANCLDAVRHHQAGELLAIRLGGLRRGVAGNRGDSGLAKENVHPIARGSLGPRARR